MPFFSLAEILMKYHVSCMDQINTPWYYGVPTTHNVSPPPMFTVVKKCARNMYEIFWYNPSI